MYRGATLRSPTNRLPPLDLRPVRSEPRRGLDVVDVSGDEEVRVLSRLGARGNRDRETPAAGIRVAAAQSGATGAIVP